MKKCIDCDCKISSVSKRCQPCFHIFLSGNNHPLKGKHRSNEVKSKISEKLTGKPSTSTTKFQKGHIPWIKTHGHLFRRENSANWKGGRIFKNTGYIMLRMPDHPTADSQGYILEHRYVMEQKIGRLLKTEEQVHHINRNKKDNRPDNLMLFVNVSAHKLFHSKLI
jgi:hypothetical protein